MRYGGRLCEICGSAEHAEIFSWDHVAKTRIRDFKWSIRNVVCKSCGFAFVSPAPTPESLHEFYSRALRCLTAPKSEFRRGFLF
jgi:hypothetical protein